MSFIVIGQWKAGDMIPNEVELARDFGVSVGTMRKALQTLTEQGLLTRRQGRGTFVAEPRAMDPAPLDNLRTSGDERLEWTVAQKNLSSGHATPTEASALALEEGEPVWRLRRLLRDTITSSAMLEYSTLPEAPFASLAADGDAQELPVSFLARRYGILIGPSTEKIRIVLADGENTKLLNVKSGVPLLKMERVAMSFEGVAMEYRVAYCNLENGAVYSNQMR